MSDSLGGRMSLDIRDVKAKITELNNLIKENESQWRADAAQMDDWTGSQEGLEDRVKSLNKQVDLQKQKLDIWIQRKEALVNAEEKDAKAIREANDEIIKYSKQLEKSQKELKGAENSLDKFNNELQDNDKKADKAEKETKELNKEVKESDKSFGIATVAIGNFVANGLSSMVSAIGGAISSFAGLADSTIEIRKEMGLLESVAKQTGANADSIIDKWVDMTAVIGDEGAVREGISNLLTAGFTAKKEMDAITKALEGASIQWRDTLSFEGLSDSLQEWIGSKGESLSGNFAELLERLGYNLEEVTAQTEGMTDAQRRQWAVTQLNKNGMSELSEAYRESNEELIELERANRELEIAQAGLGEAMSPMVAAVKSSVADIVYSFTDMINGVEGAGDQLLYNVGYLAGQLYSGIQKLMNQLLPTAGEFFPKLILLITENLPVMVQQGVAIITSLFQGISETAPKITQGIGDMISSILMTIATNGPVLLSSAVDMFGNIVTGLLQMVVDLTGKVPEIITTVMNGLINGKGSLLDTAIDVLMQIVNAIPSVIDGLLANLPGIIQSIVSSLAEAVPKVFDAALRLLNTVVEAIPEIITSLVKNLPSIISTIMTSLADAAPKVLNSALNLLLEIPKACWQVTPKVFAAVPQIISAIVKGLMEGIPKCLQAGLDIMKGLINGILSFDIKGAIKGVGDSIINGFKSFFGIHSPSTLMREEIGTNIGEGIVEGIKDTEDDIVEAAEDVSVGFTQGFVDGMNGTKSVLKDAVEETIEEATDINPKATGKKLAENIGNEIQSTLSEVTDTVDMEEPESEIAEKVGKKIEKVVNSTKDIISGLSEGSTETTADNIIGMLGNMVGGPWGTFIDTFWSFISDNLLNMGTEEVINIADTMVTTLVNTITDILEDLPQILTSAITFMSRFAIGLIQGIPKIIAKIPQIVAEFAKALITEGIPAMLNVGVELMMGIVKGMMSIGQKVFNGIKKAVNWVVDGIKWLFGIKSPSKVMADEVGKNLALGMEQGLVDNLGGLNDAIKNGVDTSVELDQKVTGRKMVNVYQTNNYAQAHTRYEIYKSKKDIANSVRFAMQGV